MDRYKGRVQAYDIINEQIADNGTLKDTIWSRAFGYDLFEKGLRYARAADPKAKLFINDYNIEGINNKSDALYALAKQLLTKRVPLDGVGFQAHFTLGSIPPTLKENLRRFSDLGLQVAITELDIRQPLNATNPELHYQEYKQVVQACPQCVSITKWGVWDAGSWIPGFFPGYGSALTYDKEFRTKKAWYGFRDGLASL
ncbi:glycoside hydrolase family 10 protein [Atractiella rhizophila]|nr:glycoside hydrolase family 10 protein [Atractiella rhizophila]